jgi:hypothetical protein
MLSTWTGYAFKREDIAMRKLISLGFGALLALSVAGTAFADNPHAGNSGHFKGSAGPCSTSSNNPNCPPFGG